MTTTRPDTSKLPVYIRGWCPNCQNTMRQDPEEAKEDRPMVCIDCGSDMIQPERMDRKTLATFKMQCWFYDVSAAGMMGPSPGGAASELRCSRSMIDRLAERGVLERSVYAEDGYFLVFISDRSIKRANENKDNTGTWTGRERGQEPADLEEE